MSSFKKVVADNGGVVGLLKAIDPNIAKSVAVLTLAAVFLGTAPFLEGTSSGWKSSHMHRPTFAELTHERQLIAVYFLGYLFTCAIVAVSAGTAENKPGVTALTGLIASVGLWVVIVVRIASATHASDNIHSEVVVPWFSALSAVGLAVAPATFTVVPKIVKDL